MSKIAKKRLKPKIEIVKKDIFNSGNLFAYSPEFKILTDNKNMVEFEVESPPISVIKTLKFKNKPDLSYELESKLIPNQDGSKVIFIHDSMQYYIDKTFCEYFEDKYKEVKYYWIKKFLGKEVEEKIGVINNKKLIGILVCQKEN